MNTLNSSESTFFPQKFACIEHVEKLWGEEEIFVGLKFKKRRRRMKGTNED